MPEWWLTFAEIITNKKDIVIPPNITLESGYYFTWVNKRKWELFSNDGISTNIFVIGRGQQLERKIKSAYPNYLNIN